MGKKQEKKSAKGRLDKFYWLAKEQGYRARSAFKLVQLNKKFNFLESSKCCIDLCAAPGGWLQVASRNMPQGSLIVGVDLVPIRPIPHCVTFAEDINSYKCRERLRDELRDWRADVVLHDGAPNVGTAWVQDAYTQNELVLQSLKLAVEFLAKGGVFVTKVFRSKDYNSLIWVFNQLFGKVEATKPPSSRNVSAEIFVVCQDFKAPSRIDPKFLDPRHVFKDLDPSSSISGPELVLDPLTGEMVPVNKPNVPSNSKASANVFEPQKTRRHRDGYEDGDYIMFKTINVEEFFKSHDAISVLGTYNTINFDGKEGKRIRKLEITSDDIKENCKDLKVLGKKDFRNLLKWRKLLREEAGLEVVPKVKGEGALNSNTEGGENVEVTQDEPLNSDDEARELDEEIERLGDLESKKKRKERRKRNELKQKLVMKLQLKMGTPLDIGMDMMDETREASGDVKDMFSLKKRRDALALKEKSESNEDEDDDGLLEEDQQKLEKQFQLAQDNPDIDFEVESEEEEDDDEEEDEEAKKVRKLEKSMDDLYDDYRSRVSERDAKFRVRAAKLADKSSKWEEWGGIKEKKRGGDDDEDGEAGEGEDGEDGNESEEDHGEIAARGYDEVMKMKEGEETLDTDDEEDEKEEEEDRLIRLENKARLNRKRKDREEELQRQSENDGKKQKVNRKGLVVDLENEKDKEIRASRDALIWFDNPLFKGIGKALEAVDDEEEEEEEESEDESESGEEEVESDEELGEEEVSDDDSFEIVPPEGLEFADDDELPEWDYDDLDTEEAKNRDIADNGLTTAEAITLAQQLVNREATKSSLIDSGFSKQNFVDKSDLPSWFLDDEQKHWKANTPITKEAVQALRARVKALDARPIKKIAEAKARKKMRTVRRLEKAMKKADTMNEAEDVSEREKSSNINKVLLKAAGNKPSKKNEKTLVVARGPNRGIKGRPKGAKGRYRMVDRRMKKEIRANKRTDKKNGKKKSSSTGSKKKAANGY